MTKKKAFLISLVAVITWFLLRSDELLTFLCGKGKLSCQDNFYYFSYYFLLFMPILLFSILTYFIKEEVFKVWLKFTYWYFLIYILAILFLSDMGGGGGYLIGHMDSKFFAVTLSGLYVIISFFLVLLLFPLKASKK